MRIEARIESDGKPALFFPDRASGEVGVLCFTASDGHTSASRAYMRQCKKPETLDQVSRVLALLRQWASMPH